MAEVKTLRSGPPRGGEGGARGVLAADIEAPRLAREFLNTVATRCPEEVFGRARQIVNELVSNAVKHADCDEIVVELWTRSGGAIDIVVTDDGPGFSMPPRAAGHDDTSGWGLLFVDLMSEAWETGGPGSPWVWAHLEPRPTVSAVNLHRGEVDPIPDERIRDLLDVRLLMDSVKDYAICALDTAGRIVLWNAGAERLTGYRSGEIRGCTLEKLHDEASSPVYDGDLATALAHGRYENERWVVRKDGSRFWADSVITPIFDSQGTLRGFAAIMQDVTWRMRLDEDRLGLITRVKELARTDELTGLANRRRWHEELDRELARARRHKSGLCVAMVDLDGFKELNDLHGHQAGDQVLRDTARLWSDAVRATDMLGRYGGDEFAVVLPDCRLEEALVVIDRMRQATPAPATCSAGIACSQGSEPAENVVGRADAALYQAKKQGRNKTVSC